MDIKIHNVRLGFATNSSSTHSMAFIKGAHDDLVGDGEYGFGWGNFTAASKKTKSVYLGLLIQYALRGMCDDRTANLIITDVTGEKLDISDDKYDSYIDHQSVYSLPHNWKNNGIDYEFADDMKNFLLQEDLVILGGNDNEEESHPLFGKGTFANLALGRGGYGDALVARKDSSGFWTLFNRNSGGKIRFSFPRPGEESKPDPRRSWAFPKWGQVSPEKASAPELIDIKITDFCELGCSFCYQNSTREGKHADLHDTYGFMNALEEMKVFEVAIGGGEPTSHPKFVEILQDFRRHGIVPSFSTRDLSWLKDDSRRGKILEAAGAFAYSVDGKDSSIDEFTSLVKTYGIKNPTIHHIMMNERARDFERLIRAASKHYIHIVLLGYKPMGRGVPQKVVKQPGWIKVLAAMAEKGDIYRVSIDTSLVQMYKKELEDADVPEWLVSAREGAFSMYIDMVASKMGPSSFCKPDEMKNLDCGSYTERIKTQILEAFASW